MARCDVVQIQCDRCKRVELRPPMPVKTIPEMEMQYLGEKVIYLDLCLRCKEAIARLLGLIKEWDREVKQPFGPTVPSNSAPPLQVAPKYTPAQPHAASAKR